MGRKNAGQLSFDLEVAEPRKQRSKRLRIPAPPTTDRRVPAKKRGQADGGLIAGPQISRCGFCGTSLTVYEDAAVCPCCGVIVARPDNAE